MRFITVRFVGTCCFVDHGSFKRVVLPNDTLETSIKRHIAYVEFEDEAILSGQQLSAPYTHSSTGQIDYRRFELSGHTITIADVASASSEDDGPYRNHVPSITTVHPGLYNKPRPECFTTPPDPQLIAGAIDLESGTLTAGELYEFVTKFSNSIGTTLSIRTPKYVDLLVPILTDELTITFNDGTGAVQVVLKPTADVITIGNQPIADIEGEGSGDDVKHHFKLYYKLAKPGTVMADPPLPETPLDPVNSCTVTNWP